MDKDERQELIKQLESANPRNKAYFGIFQYGGGSDESYIKANVQGLELFAATMLKAVSQFDQACAKNETIDIAQYTDDWVNKDSTTSIDYIEPILEEIEKPKLEYKQTTLDKLVPMGCFSVLILAVISGIVGFVTIVNWFLSLYNQSQ
ncbi:hypothetical protein HUW51_02030 [Adhaeribacter swui]|uniref:Uncharacterized protein n=1 Tax=Adhaeribacter swui TaxID=2086471 RepID=A0A7G7G327_9BACT|nr:hypothetical protein [Adhaeribacter swui]QNF31561.1 hypothetical protein HUW51_02030 [Adhaeribacter swui]